MRSAIVLRSSSLIYFIGMLLAALAVHRSATTTGRGIGNVLQEKEAATTEIPLPKMIATPFIVFLIANAYYALFFYWIMNVFDPELLQIHQELTHQEMLEYFKGTDQIANVRKNTPADYIPTLGGTISRYFLEAIGGFIVSALIGIGVRRT